MNFLLESSSYSVSPEEIRAVAGILKTGGVIVTPTDTLYGLAASAFNVKAVERVFRVKNRMSTMALPLLLSNTNDLDLCARSVPDVAIELAERFWPGPLTIVLNRSASIPNVVTGGLKSVALRVPNHPVPRAIVQELGCPITGTSANRTGSPPPFSSVAAYEQFGEEVDYIIEGGICEVGEPSTILDLTGSVPVLLREGALPYAHILEVLKDDVNITE